MPNGDPRGGFFYPTLTFMIDSYYLAEAERAGCFALIVFLLLCGCQFSVSLPRSAKDWQQLSIYRDLPASKMSKYFLKWCTDISLPLS